MENHPTTAGPGSAADATTLALAANSRTYPYEFAVILDPAAFEATFRARLASEDPAAPFRPGVFRVRDFGVPNFADIAPPQLLNGALVFYAVDTITGLPYRVEAPDPAGTPTYEPLPLTPLPPAPPVGEADEDVVLPRKPSEWLLEDDDSGEVPPPFPLR